MLKTTDCGKKLTSYIRSLKEIEAQLIKTHTEADLPAPWREVCHMARIAPALLQCLQESKSLLEQTYSALSKGAGTLNEGERKYLETMSNVLYSCERAIEVATTGATSQSTMLH